MQTIVAYPSEFDSEWIPCKGQNWSHCEREANKKYHQWPHKGHKGQIKNDETNMSGENNMSKR